jgi:hypothetical protein
MKTLKIFTAVLLALANLSLNSSQPKETLNGKWKLICFHDLETNIQDCRPADERSRFITLTFTDDGKEGTLEGQTTTNKVWGSYQIFNGNQMKVKEFGGTKVGESGWGGYMLWKTISQSSSFSYHFDTLLIYYDFDTKAMKFIDAEK